MCSLAKNWEVRDNIKDNWVGIRGEFTIRESLLNSSTKEEALLPNKVSWHLPTQPHCLWVPAVWSYFPVRGSFIACGSPLGNEDSPLLVTYDTPELKQWEEMGDHNTVNVLKSWMGKAIWLAGYTISHHLLSFGNNKSCSLR